MTSRTRALQLQAEINSLPVFTKRQRLCFSLVTKEQFQAIMDFLKNHISENRAGLQKAANHIKISYPLLIKWRQKLRINPDYNPKPDYDLLHRAMSNRLEEQILVEIETQFIEKGYYFNNQILKLVALRAWRNAPAEDKLRRDFKASNKWCKNFRLRHGYVWRKAHLKRRPIPNEQLEAYKRDFRNEIQQLADTLNQQGLLFTLANMDETSWKLAYFNQLTWAKKGAKEVIIRSNYNTKDSFTTLATIHADVTNNPKLPLFLIARGKGERCHRQFENIKEQFPGTEVYHSESGWSTVDVVQEYFAWLRRVYDQMFENKENYIPGETRIHLVIDCYASHRNKKTKNIARNYNISLHFIPPGATDEYQPLDIKVFGALKAKARGAWYQVLYENPEIVPTRSKAATILVQCWESLSDEVLESAWNLYLRACQEEDQEERVSLLYENTMHAHEFHQAISDSMLHDMEDNDATISSVSHEEEEEEDEEEEGYYEVMCEDSDDDDTSNEGYEGWEDESDEFLENVKAQFCSYYEQNPECTANDDEELNEDMNNSSDNESDDEPDDEQDDVPNNEPDDEPDDEQDDVPNNEPDDEPNNEPDDGMALQDPDESINFKIQNFQSFMENDIKLKQERAENNEIDESQVENAYGIQNIGSSCYFNTFIQLLLAIPNVEEIIVDIDSIESEDGQNIYNIIDAVYGLMRTNICTITREILMTLCSEISNDLVDLISVPDGSCPELFIRSFLQPNKITIAYVDPMESFIDQVPEHFERVLFMIRTTGIRSSKFDFPLTFSKQGIKMGLKMVITNPYNHFIAFLRNGIEDDFTKIDDSRITFNQHIPATQTNIALYIKLNE